MNEPGSEPLLEMEGIRKRFPGVLALDGVDLALKKGEVLALLGENGAGKSTLIKMLGGAHQADEGDSESALGETEPEQTSESEQELGREVEISSEEESVGTSDEITAPTPAVVPAVADVQGV